MNHLLYLAFKKSRLNRLMYNVRKDKCHGRVDINAENVERAERLLQSLQPDPKNSCLCDNEVDPDPEYDLQIVVPAYNVEKYIGECLDSVLAQKTSFRYVVKVVNDGSTDGTARVLEAYRHHPQIRLISQENKGFSGARNTGLRRIEARYVLFLDSDDRLAPGAIEALMRKAQETGADIVEGSSVKFWGPVVTKHFHHADAEEVGTDRLFGFPWGKVFRASMFRWIHFPESYWFEDTLCALILHPMAKKVCTIRHQVYAYRTNLHGISRNFRGKPKCLDSFYVTRQLWTDRTTLGWTADDAWAQKLARQFRLNARRIASLNNEEVNRALFVLQSHWIRTDFKQVRTKDALVCALQDGDYKAFKLQMRWL